MTTQSKSASPSPERSQAHRKLQTLLQTQVLPLSQRVLNQSQNLAQFCLHQFQRLSRQNQFLLVGALMSVLLLRPQLLPSFQEAIAPSRSPYPPLVMAQGDPYLRALMRTISASESNDPNPYKLLYGGSYFTDTATHPDQCITITTGPNSGDCSTAAGRYQFITSTWEEKAKLYHPHPEGWLFWQHYPFDAKSQDEVVYNWLADPDAWGIDIRTLLKDGQLPEVLARLSSTWTSLGYGIETNDMTPHLETLYRQFLDEELKATAMGDRTDASNTAFYRFGNQSSY
ncbi:MAG TPA: glycoside hydrolase family protein [Stenomitos sp.]